VSGPRFAPHSGSLSCSPSRRVPRAGRNPSPCCGSRTLSPRRFIRRRAAIRSTPRSLAKPERPLLRRRGSTGRRVGCGALGAREGRARRAEAHDRHPASSRGTGVGRAILDVIEESAGREDVRVIRLETGTQSTAALTLYRRYGYRERGPFAAIRRCAYDLHAEAPARRLSALQRVWRRRLLRLGPACGRGGAASRLTAPLASVSGWSSVRSLCTVKVGCFLGDRLPDRPGGLSVPR